MGKPPTPADPSPPISSSSSLSTPSTEPSDEAPPDYSQAVSSHPSTQSDQLIRPTETLYFIPGGRRYNSILQRKRHSGIVTLDPDLSSDANTLHDLITSQIGLPPRPCLIINGYHRETRSNGGKSETKTVTDFDFRIDLTTTLLRWGPDHTGRNQEWSYTTVVSDNDGDKAFRGTRIKSRSRSNKPGRIALPDDDATPEEGARLMDLESGEDTPGMKGWCQRFCADTAGVKSFTYRRNLSGFDPSPMRASFISHIRSTGYRGHISINPSLSSSVITIYSPHWINRLRNNTFVFWACIILQLWPITWPVIWFMERRYDVIRSEWFTAKSISESGRTKKVYAGGMDEATAAESWAPVIREAAWRQCRDGAILGEEEVRQLRRQGLQRRNAEGENGAGLVARGQAALGMMGIREIGGVNVTGTWGGDTNTRGGGSSFTIRTG